MKEPLKKKFKRLLVEEGIRQNYKDYFSDDDFARVVKGEFAPHFLKLARPMANPSWSTSQNIVYAG